MRYRIVEGLNDWAEFGFIVQRRRWNLLWYEWVSVNSYRSFQDAKNYIDKLQKQYDTKHNPKVLYECRIPPKESE